ncbi:MAG TPA: hypothetical protein VM433_01605 [Mycobacteriales bacterium]|nr:hypothetical protein [Mycobacteriales bacterium]
MPDLTPEPSQPDGPPTEGEELALQPVDPSDAPVPPWRRRGPVLGIAAGLAALAMAGSAVLVATSSGGEDALVASALPSASPSVSPTPSPARTPSEQPTPTPEPTEAEPPPPTVEPTRAPVTAAAAPAPVAPPAAPAPEPAPTTPGPTASPSPARTVAEPDESTVTLVNETTLELEYVFQFSDGNRDSGGPGYDRTDRYVVPAGGRLTVFLRNSGYGTGTSAVWTRDRACAWHDGDGPGPKPGSTSSVIVRHAGDGPHPACGGQRELHGQFSPYENWQ